MKSERDPRTGHRLWPAGLLPVLVAGLCAAPALASDGVIEINQAKVIKAGGFPYVINKAGSYRLTSNLDVRVAAHPIDTDAIDVTADYVTIDLNGFTILGPAVCSGVPVNSCNNGSIIATGFGVFTVSGPRQSVAVRNGTIQGMGKGGIDLRGNTSTVERVRVVANVGSGIFLANGLVMNCEVSSNLGVGIFTGSGLITGNVSIGNSGAGIQTFGGTVSGNTAIINGGTGFGVTAGVVSSNTSSDNKGNGFDVEAGVVSNNTSLGNTGVGLHLTANVGYVGNVLFGNVNGTVTSGVQIGQNLCNGKPTCP